MTRLRVFLLALLIGIINAVVFVIFEWIVNEGTNYIWNDLFMSDIFRWIVIPLAIVLGIGFSFVLRLLKQDRIVPVKLDLLEETKISPTSLKTLGIIFVVGIVSLLAGASLGPEASLTALSVGLGAWFAQKSNNVKAGSLYALSSVGALLVAFFGSLLPILIPVLMLYQKEKKIVIAHMLPPIISGFAAYISLIVIKGKPEGYGTIPVSPHFQLFDFITALLLGIIGTFIAFLLKWLIKKFITVSQRLGKRFSWIISAGIFGLIIGILYFIGGQSIQFSGNVGTKLLSQTFTSYTALYILVIIVAKVLVTSWSLSSGYRGGLVFPSIFMGAALGFFAERIDSGLAGPGIILGSISGILTAMTSPVMGFIMILSISPIQLLGIALAGMAGAMLGSKLISKIKK